MTSVSSEKVNNWDFIREEKKIEKRLFINNVIFLSDKIFILLFPKKIS